MKKLFLFLTVFAAFAVNAQISFDNVGTKNYFPKYIGQTKIGNSNSYETTTGYLYTPTLSVNSTTTVATGVKFHVTGASYLRSYTTSTAVPVMQVRDSANTSLFKILNTGSIYTGTLQAVSSDTYAVTGATITVTNGLITNIAR